MGHNDYFLACIHGTNSRRSWVKCKLLGLGEATMILELEMLAECFSKHIYDINSIFGKHVPVALEAATFTYNGPIAL